ncbi:MAG: hypothetical protein IJD28_01740 [Deferribacterales bacterium]|nr:hypothetical protein [Deferribacterales bacterium]
MTHKFDDNSVEALLKTLANKQDVTVPDSFTASVMSRIRNDSKQKVVYFDKIYWRFSLAASAVAAACLLLAINFFASYNPGAAEFAAIDYFNLANF